MNGQISCQKPWAGNLKLIGLVGGYFAKTIYFVPPGRETLRGHFFCQKEKKGFFSFHPFNKGVL